MDANRSSAGTAGNGGGSGSGGEECGGNGTNGGGAGSEYKELDVDGAVVELEQCETIDLDSTVVFVLRVQTSAMDKVFQIGCDNVGSANSWREAIHRSAQNAAQNADEQRKKEKNLRVAKEMSDMIIYFRSVPFKEDREMSFFEMCSFPETKAEKYFFQQYQQHFVRFHRTKISRVYPKGQRLDSSNFSPIPFWNAGSQMIALNYQTPDKSMQLNQAKFRDNGACGFVLKPEYMFSESPEEALLRVTAKVVTLRVIGARYLCRSNRNINCPLVEVEVQGSSMDSGIKMKTKGIGEYS